MKRKEAGFLSALGALSGGILVLISLPLQGVFTGPAPTTSTTVSETQTAATSSSSPQNLQLTAEDCLLPVPATANVTIVTQGNVTGTLVRNGIEPGMFYPLDFCPQPVWNRTFVYSTANGYSKISGTNDYEFALHAVMNPIFQALQNGTTFLYSQPGLGPYQTDLNSDGTSNGQGYFFQVMFFHYGGVITDWCGYKGANRLNVTAGIQVEFFAQYLVPFNGTYVPGNWNLASPQISAMTQTELDIENGCFFG